MAKIRIRPELLEEEQQHRLGLTSPDQWGDEWSYVEFIAGTYKRGHVVRDIPYNVLIGNSGVGSVTAAAAAGTFTLEDTGEFASDDFRGAIGLIDGGAGEGQHFIVQKVIDDDKLRITMFNGRGWETALATDSRYRLVLPGRADLSVSTSGHVRGVIQRDGFTVPTGETRHGWVKKTGVAAVIRDNSGVDFSTEGFVIPTTAGAVIGSVNKTHSFGIALHGNPAEDTADFTVLVDLQILNHSMSFRFPKGKEEPYSDVHI